MAIFRLVLIFLLIYFVIKMLSRIFFPPIQSQNRQEFTREDRNHREGDVIVENKDGRIKQEKKQEGDYTDYEEVD